MLKKFDYEKIPIVEIVNEILVDSSKRGASDIHFDPQEKYMKIRIRVDGALMDYSEVPNDVKKNLITRIKIIAGMNITESRLPQDGAIKATVQNMNLDLRVSALPTLDGEKIVIRILDYSMSSSGLENLGFNKYNYEKVLKMMSAPNGIILVTGATGSGKSTTVYSILQRLNKEDTNIITVEDPIEMNITGINQVQTNSEIGLTFASALRSILRQDPNIIMIGEIRDSETARIAVRASITGHLVLSTIHTNSSLNTIERLLDMDVERYLLSSALTGIISQKLARRLCPHCREKRKTNEYEKNLFNKILHKEIDEIYTTVGCDECRNGYKGRIAIHEVLLINQAIRDAISGNVRKEKLRELVYSADVITLLQDGLEKVIDGETTFEELLKIIDLENDDNEKAGDYSLNDAIDMTHITHHPNDGKIENNLKKDFDSFNKDLDKDNDNLDSLNINNEELKNVDTTIFEDEEDNLKNTTSYTNEKDTEDFSTDKDPIFDKLASLTKNNEESTLDEQNNTNSPLDTYDDFDLNFDNDKSVDHDIDDLLDRLNRE